MKTDLSAFGAYTVDNWDGEAAKAIPEEVLKLARELVARTKDSFDLPDASPGVTGSIGLIWHVGGDYIYITVRDSRTAKFFLRSPQGTKTDKWIEAASADDLLEELVARLYGTKAQVIQKPFIAPDFVIEIEPTRRSMTYPMLPGKEWATEVEQKLKVA